MNTSTKEQETSPKEQETSPKEQESSPKTMPLQLDGELASIWSLLEQKVCSEDSIIKAYTQKITLAQDNSNLSILQILQMNGILTPEQYKKYSSINTATRTYTPPLPTTSELEMKLAFSLVAEKKLSNKDVQTVLRTQAMLFKLGIEYSLLQILADTNLVDRSLLPISFPKSSDEPKNITIEQRNIKNVAIVAKKRSSHVAMILLIIFVSVICLFILSLDHATKAFQEKQQRIAEEKEQQEILLKRQYAEKQRQERLERRKNREKQVEKFDAQAHQQHIQDIMHSRGLSAWGDYWIDQREAKILSQSYRVGDTADDFKLQCNFQGLKYKRMPIGLEIYLQTNLPKGIICHFEVMISHAMYDQKMYAYKNIPVEITEQNLILNLSPFPKELAPGFYKVHILFSILNQSNFTQYFLTLKKNYSWIYTFQLGTQENIEKHQQKVYKDIDNYFEFTNNLITQMPDANNETLLRQFQLLEEQEKKLDQEYLIPVFPTLETQWEKLNKTLYALSMKLQEKEDIDKDFYYESYDNLYLKYLKEKEKLNNKKQFENVNIIRLSEKD